MTIWILFLDKVDIFRNRFFDHLEIWRLGYQPFSDTHQMDSIMVNYAGQIITTSLRPHWNHG